MRLSAVLLVIAALALPRDAECSRDRPGRKRRSHADPFAEAAPGTLPHEGLLPIRIDARGGRAFLELPPPAGPDGESFRALHVESLVTGLGSNDVGLDRGQLGRTSVVRFRRVGGRVLLEEPNLRFRALTSDAPEARAAREAFVTSVTWSAPIAAETDDGRLLVELTPFLLRDAHGIAHRLEEAGQGGYELDAERSTLDPSACLAFPDNLVFESLLTFAGGAPGPHVRSVAPDPTALTFRQRHELVRLPDDGYVPRELDPRSGSLSMGFMDLAAPIAAPVQRRLVVRHRLQKTDPSSARSRVRRPIVYHVDPGIPEPVRSAVVEGAGWWRRAFEEAGFVDAFQVRLLPPDAHPLDVRFNVIEWVHRATRGWSYGSGVTDPRTGERLKGHVNLGSLRVRQDRLLIEGLAGTDLTGTGRPGDPVQVALARIRQLAAHEVGHALGLAHAFAASTRDGRSSVMDYPAPLVRATPSGGLDLSDAYAVGVGTWDVRAIAHLYGQPAPGEDDAAFVRALVEESVARGHLFLTDADARPLGGAHPLASLWDNGADPVAELPRLLRVREVALGAFGERAILPGTPLALLHERLVPVYLLHRYQVAATAKTLAGVEYRHALRGEDASTRPVPPERQRRALSALLETLEPTRLELPERVLALLLPRPPGHPRHRELLASSTDPTFDALAAAAAAADLTVRALLEPSRAARLVDQHRRDPSQPGLLEVVAALEERVFGTTEEDPRRAEIRRAVQSVVTRALQDLCDGPSSSWAVRARARDALERLAERLVETEPDESPSARAHRRALRADIDAFLEGRERSRPRLPAPEAPPPGSPIGHRAGLAGCSQPG